MSLAAELHQRSPSRAFACPVEPVVKVVVAGTVEAAVEATDARWPSVGQALARASAGQASPYSRVHFILYIARLIPMLAMQKQTLVFTQVSPQPTRVSRGKGTVRAELRGSRGRTSA